jgi:hypothetical protein
MRGWHRYARAHGVINDVTSIAQFLKNRIGLLCNIDLEADVIGDLVRFFWTVRYAPSQGNHSDEIDEGLSAFAVVDDIRLALLVRRETFFQMRHGIWCDKTTLLTLLYISIGGLQEATIATENLVFRIACEAIEGGGGVYDGTVVTTNINDSK